MSIIQWTKNLGNSWFKDLMIFILSKNYRSNHVQNILNLIRQGANFKLLPNNVVELNDEKIKVSENSAGFAINHYHRIKKLKEKGFTFRVKANHLFLSKGELVLKVFSSEDLYIINELFVDHIYSIDNIDPSKTSVIDVGSNKGYAALYFLHSLKVKQVFGFELVPTTFKFSEEVIELNDHLKHRIRIQNVGLGKETSTASVNIDLQNLSLTSLYNQTTSSTSLTEVCKIIDAKGAFEQILEIETQDKFIVKIDCEGAEKDIVEKIKPILENRRITHLFIEWHFNNLQSIENIIDESGFDIEKHELSEGNGLLKATRI